MKYKNFFEYKNNEESSKSLLSHVQPRNILQKIILAHILLIGLFILLKSYQLLVVASNLNHHHPVQKLYPSPKKIPLSGFIFSFFVALRIYSPNPRYERASFLRNRILSNFIRFNKKNSKYSNQGFAHEIHCYFLA